MNTHLIKELPADHVERINAWWDLVGKVSEMPADKVWVFVDGELVEEK